MYTHVIWDIDNTMVSSGGVILRALARLLREEKGVELTDDLHQHLVGLTSRNILRYFEFNDMAAAEEKWNEYIFSDSEGFQAYDGVIETLHKLKEDGFALGIVTSRNESEMHDSCLDELLPLFDCVVQAEEVKKPKPDPESLRLYCARSGARPEEILYIGDGPADALCCEAVGVDFALALWGCYNPGLVSSAKYRLNAPEEILKLV